MIFSNDATKGLLTHLARSHNKIKYKYKLRRELTEHIKRLKGESPEPLKKRIEELEKTLHETLEKENIILKHEKIEEYAHDKIKTKVNILDVKLGKFLETAQGRKARIEELEQKVHKRFATRKEKIEDLNNDLVTFEKMYNEIKKTGKYKKQLIIVKNRIQKIKQLLKSINVS